MENKEQKSANDLATVRTDLAVERSVMAANRTLMAWVRTALSMIGFGFTIYKVLRAVSQEQLSNMPAVGPRRIGMFLIVLGTVSMILGTMEYVHTMKHLDKLSKRVYKPWNFATIAGFAVGLLGVFLIVSFLIHRDFF